jgi:hypothetical protein
MTHDELLTSIDSPNFRGSRTAETPYLALRAVLEIHAPFESGVCGCELDQPRISYIYPCKTVRTIQRELGL